jgi:2-hydroxycyclohexanecarboxyl-CoA dehydrogenase
MPDSNSAGGGAEGRVALVTGASGVIGKTVVSRLQDEGWKVAGLDLNEGAGDLALRADVTVRDALRDAGERVARELGPIDLLVVATNHYERAPMGELPSDSWRRMLGVNLGGAVNAVAAVAPEMVERGRGTIVTTTSWLSFAGGGAGEAYYAASIGAVIAFTKSFAVEVAGRGVRVNCIAVGPTQGTGSEYELPGSADLPAGRLASPDDVAETVLFLAERGDFYVGQVFKPTAGAVM